MKQDIAPYLTLDGYQEFAARTAIYNNRKHPHWLDRENFEPDIWAVNYCALGVAGEGGEVANKWAKFFRDDCKPGEEPKISEERRQKMKMELGGALWYIAECATQLGFRLHEVAAANLEELQSRQERGTLRGDGDDR